MKHAGSGHISLNKKLRQGTTSLVATYASGALEIARSMGPRAPPSIQGWSDKYLTSAEHVYKKAHGAKLRTPDWKTHDEKVQPY